jgi:hypothetical protein
MMSAPTSDFPPEVEARIRELVDSWPEFTPEVSAQLSILLRPAALGTEQRAA